MYCRIGDKCITPAQMNLIFRARLLWRNAATWMRIYLGKAYSGYDTQPVNEKLKHVNLDYGNVLRVFFGDKVTEEYINLLNSYVTIYQALFKAMMAGDQDAVNAYAKQLYENIDARAATLSKINPFWQEAKMKDLLYQFTDLLLQDAAAIASNDSAKDIDLIEKLLAHSTVIGDYFSEGLINYLTYTAR